MRWRSLFLVCHFIALVCALAAPAFAQSSEELTSARRLFADALKDEEQAHYGVALEKFQRVQKVRDTAPIRYRIGSCLEGLGRLRQAAAAYQGAISIGQKDPEVVRGAKGRLASVERKMAKLSISMSDKAQDAQLRIDEEAIAPGALGRPIPLDPGRHTVTATAKDAAPFRTEISLPEGGHVSLTISLDPTAGVMNSQANETTPPPPQTPIQPGAPPPQPGEDTSSRRTVGYVVSGVGAALVVGAGVTLLMRSAEIATLNKNCPGGACPISQRDQLTSARNRALVEGPLGVGLGALGIVAMGVGAYIVLTSPPPSNDAPPQSEPAESARLEPWVSPHGGGLMLGGAF
jgi:hypothetical protein